MRALLAGATGLVGSRVLRRLADDAAWSGVTVLARTPPARLPGTPDRVRLVTCRFEELGALRPFPAADAVLCCLGTTIRKAGSQDAFHRVDHDFVLELARRARSAGATRFALVSATGADAGSRVFYNRVKGETERDLRAMRWESLSIVRPSLLDGPRREFRAGERIALALAWPIAALLPARLRPVSADAVAAALVGLAARGEPGVRVVESESIRALAAGAR